MPDTIPFSPPLEVLSTRTDLLREDVRRLHPLLDLLDPQEGDETTLFAGRLLDLLTRIEASYSDQAAAFRSLTTRLDAIDARLALLLGEPDRAPASTSSPSSPPRGPAGSSAPATACAGRRAASSSPARTPGGSSSISRQGPSRSTRAPRCPGRGPPSRANWSIDGGSSGGPPRSIPLTTGRRDGDDRRSEAGRARVRRPAPHASSRCRSPARPARAAASPPPARLTPRQDPPRRSAAPSPGASPPPSSPARARSRAAAPGSRSAPSCRTPAPGPPWLGHIVPALAPTRATDRSDVATPTCITTIVNPRVADQRELQGEREHDFRRKAALLPQQPLSPHGTKPQATGRGTRRVG